jgi:hypothetical protein
LRLGSLHVDHGLLHSLKHLCLHNQHLLKSRRRGWWRVDVLVVLSIVVPVVVVVAIPCVGSGSGGIANVPFLIRLMSQNNQCFSGCPSHDCLERSPRCRCLDHLAYAADAIGHRPLVDHHTYVPKV